MKILVPVKRVVDYNVKVRIKSDGSDVDIANVKMSLNPFDEIALEEAIRLKEKGIATEIIAITCATEQSQDILRSAMAMGADRAILVQIDASMSLQPLGVAKIVREIVKLEQPNLILMGKQAIDDDCNQTAQMLSALLDYPQATFASKINITEHNNVKVADVTREIDGGLETNRVTIPCVISVDLRLNEPRFITLPNIMKAKKKLIELKTIAELGLTETDISPRLTTLKVSEPPVRQAGIKVNSVEELVHKLKTEAKVL
jgi:electron transfer flavoprotein beta subunit